MQDLKTPKNKYEPWPELPGLREFFKTCTLPEGAFSSPECELATDPEKFVKAHLETCEANNGSPTYKPYLDMLIKFKEKVK